MLRYKPALAQTIPDCGVDFDFWPAINVDGQAFPFLDSLTHGCAIAAIRNSMGMVMPNNLQFEFLFSESRFSNAGMYPRASV